MAGALAFRYTGSRGLSNVDSDADCEGEGCTELVLDGSPVGDWIGNMNGLAVEDSVMVHESYMADVIRKSTLSTLNLLIHAHLRI